MPVFFEYIYAFLKEKNSRNGTEMGKSKAMVSSCFNWKRLGIRTFPLLKVQESDGELGAEIVVD